MQTKHVNSGAGTEPNFFTKLVRIAKPIQMKTKTKTKYDTRNFPAMGDMLTATKVAGCELLTKNGRYEALSDVRDNKVRVRFDDGIADEITATHFTGFNHKPKTK